MAHRSVLRTIVIDIDANDAVHTSELMFRGAATGQTLREHWTATASALDT